MKNYFFRPTSRSPTCNSSSNQRNFSNKKDKINRNFMDLCTELPKVRTLSSSPSISMKCVNLLNRNSISSDNIGISDVEHWKFTRKRLRKSRRESLKSVLHNPPHYLYRDNYLGTFQRSISLQQIKCKKSDSTPTFISANSLLGSTSLNSVENFGFSKDKPRQSTVFMKQTQLQCSHYVSSDNIYCQLAKNNMKNGLLETVEHIVDYIPIKERSFQNFAVSVCNKHCDSINGTSKQIMNRYVCSTNRSPLYSSNSPLQHTGFKNNNNGRNHCSVFIYSLVQAGIVHVSTIHQSLTGGRPFCFVFTGPIVQMSSVGKKECPEDTTLFTRIFAAESWESRARWMKSLRRTAKPNLENEYHLENSLKLSILEARNIPPKRRYYCDICLDRTLYARTTSKTSASGIFWAEDFDLNNLPNISVMTISLYREGGPTSKDSRRMRTSRISLKKRRKSPNQLVGYITIPVTQISSRTDIQTWLTLQPPVENSSSQDNFLTDLGDIYTSESQRFDDVNRSNSLSLNLLHNYSFNNVGTTVDQRNFPQLRIRARYQSLGVLPLCNYWPLRTLVLKNSLLLTDWLEPLLSVKSKEELANSLVSLHEHNNTLIEFLTNLVVREVSDLENESMAFRSNTLATKAVECYVKFVGSSYLHHLLHLLIQRVLTCFAPWEVDPEKLSSAQCIGGSLNSSDTAAYALSPGNMLKSHQSIVAGTLICNQIMLLRYFDVVWRAIQSSLNYFPSVLIHLFSSFREALETTRGSEFCDNLISSCIFLRLICPALLSPSLFGLISAFPTEPACQRNLTLLAKSLQSLANFSTFDDKEPYMRFLNGYVSYQLSFMRMFIRSISPSSLNSPDATSYAQLNNQILMPGNNNFQQMNTSTRTVVKEIDSNIKDTIDENCELASLHLILSDVIFRDSVMPPQGNDDTLQPDTTIGNDTTNINTVAYSSNSNAVTTDSSACGTHSSLTSGAILENSFTTNFLKTPNPSVTASLPNELFLLPRILDDISRALKCSSLTSSNYSKAVHSENNNDNNHNNNPNSLFNITTTNTCSQFDVPISSSNSISNIMKSLDHVDTTDGSKQSVNSLYAHHTNNPQCTTPYYTLHYNPGFHNPLITDNFITSHRLLVPQLKQSTSLTGLPSNTPKPNQNDYDEPYISDESDFEMNDNMIGMDNQILNKDNMKFFQTQSSLSAVRIPESKKITNSKDKKKSEKKSLSLDKLDNLDTEHIYDTVPFSSSSSRSSSLTSSSAKESAMCVSHLPLNNFVNAPHNDTLNSVNHQSNEMNLLKVTDQQSVLKSNSSKSISLTNSRLTSSEIIPSNVTDNKSSTNSLNYSVSPRLFPKQVTTANVVLTKPSVMCSSSVDSTKISKVQRQFCSNNNSRENVFCRDMNEDQCFFGASDTIQSSDSSHYYPSILLNGHLNNDPTVYNKNAVSSTEELNSRSDATSYNMIQIEEDNCSYSLANDINNTTVLTISNNNNEQPKELVSEVARLRYELLLSRQDALRAANRLSKQETEIHELRQLLDKLMHNNKINTTTVDSNSHNNNNNNNNNNNINNNHSILHLKVQQENAYSQGRIKLQGNDLYSYSDKRLYPLKQSVTAVSHVQNSPNNDIKVLQSVTATFKELDDAMARLELEQNELLREQARIRERIASARPKQLTSGCAQPVSISTSSRSTKSAIHPTQFDPLLNLSINLGNHELRSPSHQIKHLNSPRISNFIRDKNSSQNEIGATPKITVSSTRTSPHI
ncbi:hypothetical protein MN116_006996 [Schistosoma mekongi]|uniref:Ras-GAP domain-containing protein n=1 Tax=Schistosoma mekongi TaxID=38744 RepID=A0AAE1Z9V0_SCHME|nr:hypothetical protein MN116_006996 [Schistosoma mekongi]